MKRQGERCAKASENSGEITKERTGKRMVHQECITVKLIISSLQMVTGKSITWPQNSRLGLCSSVLWWSLFVCLYVILVSSGRSKRSCWGDRAIVTQATLALLRGPLQTWKFNYMWNLHCTTADLKTGHSFHCGFSVTTSHLWKELSSVALNGMLKPVCCPGTLL